MRRILVAEDDLALRELYRIWLEHDGCDVVACADGREALDALERGLVLDAAVLDVDLPFVDGLSVCSYLHGRDASIPIVIVSGIDDVNPPRSRAGATDVLAKPCAREALLGALAGACTGAAPTRRSGLRQATAGIRQDHALWSVGAPSPRRPEVVSTLGKRGGDLQVSLKKLCRGELERDPGDRCGRCATASAERRRIAADTDYLVAAQRRRRSS